MPRIQRDNVQRLGGKLICRPRAKWSEGEQAEEVEIQRITDYEGWTVVGRICLVEMERKILE